MSSVPRDRKGIRRSTCAVRTCPNPPDANYHGFPKKDKTLQQEWITRCDRQGARINPLTMRVCSTHFEPECYERDLRNELLGLPSRKSRKLLPTATPTLLLPVPVDPAKGQTKPSPTPPSTPLPSSYSGPSVISLTAEQRSEYVKSIIEEYERMAKEEEENKDKEDDPEKAKKTGLAKMTEKAKKTGLTEKAKKTGLAKMTEKAKKQSLHQQQQLANCKARIATLQAKVKKTKQDMYKKSSDLSKARQQLEKLKTRNAKLKLKLNKWKMCPCKEKGAMHVVRKELLKKFTVAHVNFLMGRKAGIFTREEIINAYALRAISLPAYKFLLSKKMLSLPSEVTLKRWVKNFDVDQSKLPNGIEIEILDFAAFKEEES